MKQRLFLAVALVALLAGCASGVKLDDAPVEDRAGTTLAPGGGAGQAGQSSVRPIQADSAANDVAGPANVARIIYFDYDSNAIKPQFQSLIESHARFLRANGNRHVVVEGHTDANGSDSTNLILSQDRADAVRQYLVSNFAMDPEKITSVGYGESRPVATNETAAGRARNRRIDLVIHPEQR